MAKPYYNSEEKWDYFFHMKDQVENEKDKTKLVINYSPYDW